MHRYILSNLTGAWRLGLVLLPLMCATEQSPAQAPRIEPRVSIASIEAVQIQPDGATVDLTLRIENPEAVGVTLQALHFRCSFGDIAVARGESVLAVRLPANGAAKVPVRLDIDGMMVVALSAALSSGQPLPYRIEGTAEVGLTGIPIPFNHSGTLGLNSPSPGVPHS